MSIGNDSRYNLTPTILIVDSIGVPTENEHVDLPYDRSKVVSTAIKPSVQDYSARAGDTWSNMGARFFKGRSDLWWVLAEYSGVIDPFSELLVGATIKVPQFDTVQFETLRFDVDKKGRPSDKTITNGDEST